MSRAVLTEFWIIQFKSRRYYTKKSFGCFTCSWNFVSESFLVIMIPVQANCIYKTALRILRKFYIIRFWIQKYHWARSNFWKTSINGSTLGHYGSNKFLLEKDSNEFDKILYSIISNSRRPLSKVAYFDEIQLVDLFKPLWVRIKLILSKTLF